MMAQDMKDEHDADTGAHCGQEEYVDRRQPPQEPRRAQSENDDGHRFTCADETEQPLALAQSHELGRQAPQQQ